MGKIAELYDDRAQLERRALDNVCSCWYFDLSNAIDETDDETLQHIIDDSQYCHKQNQIENPVSEAEYDQEMRDCTDSKGAK